MSPHKSSFRDPDNFIFSRERTIYRQINENNSEDFELLMNSGLYTSLTKKKLLVPHKNSHKKFSPDKKAYKILKPQQIPFISYPYEWVFEQLKSAALLTLRIQQTALKHGMTLKDASAYNVQFIGTDPIFIDTGSFEKYSDGTPWVAYKQFCQHFLAPIALMSHTDHSISQLLRVHIDGIPLSLASKLLPKKTLINSGLLMHIHTHAKTQTMYESKTTAKKNIKRNISLEQLQALLKHLETTVNKLDYGNYKTTWKNYYQETNYTQKAMQKKKAIIKKWVSGKKNKLAWDMGGNNGEFSRLIGKNADYVVSMDNDIEAVRANYLINKKKRGKNVLPLYMDFSNPSPSIGWAHAERESLLERGPANTALALALIHHLAIGNNVPLKQIAEFMGECTQTLVIEFVPKADSQVKKLLATREDIFGEYTQENFENMFNTIFDIKDKEKIPGSERTLYLMKKRTK
jgi:ribosomal protein L11 methylase PrmA